MDLKKVTVPLVSVFSALAVILPSAWWGVNNIALKADIAPVATRVNAVLDAQMEYVTKRVGMLELRLREGKATAADVEDLRYHRERLKNLQKLKED